MNESTDWCGLLSEFAVFVDESRVNIEDLIDARPGAIIRCNGSPHESVLIHVNPQDKYLGCVGGMISDEA